jgi:hypothetical protein
MGDCLVAELIDFLFGHGEELFLKAAPEESPPPVAWPIGFFFEVYDSSGNHLGNVYGRGRTPSQIRVHNLLYQRNHPFEALVTNRSGGEMMRIERQGFPFLPTETAVISASGICLGSLRQKISFLSRFISISEGEREFARTKLPSKEQLLFPFEDLHKRAKPGIALKWEGKRHELFSSSDSVSVFFGKSDWSTAQRSVFLAVGIALAQEMRADL